MCSLCFSRVYGCAICSIPLLFVFLHMRMSSNPWSIAGVSLNLVGILGLPYHWAPLVCVPVAPLHYLSARTHTDFFYCILFFPSVFPFKTGREILHSTCVHFCCNWHAVCVAAKHQKNKMVRSSRFWALDAWYMWRSLGVQAQLPPTPWKACSLPLPVSVPFFRPSSAYKCNFWPDLTFLVLFFDKNFWAFWTY